MVNTPQTEQRIRELAIDNYSPAEIAQLIENRGVAKANLDFLTTLGLSVLAGAFIALGGVFSTLVGTESGLGFGHTRLLMGLAFSLGLILVVVAGAELFTGNNLIVMSWVSRRITLRSLLRNWFIVYVGNLLGALERRDFQDSLKGVYMLDERTFLRHAERARAMALALRRELSRPS